MDFPGLDGMSLPPPQNYWLSSAGQLDDIQRSCNAAKRNQGPKVKAESLYLAGLAYICDQVIMNISII